MTPRQHLDDQQRLIEEWHIPLTSKKHWTITTAQASMESFRLNQDDVPFIIKLVENPQYDVGLFAGNVDLYTHDCIHILLGRGLLAKDEAFVIGFTMGTTKKMFRWRRNLFMFFSKHFYPEGYKFREEERFVFNMGVMAGSRCPTDLSRFNFKKHDKKRLTELRQITKIDKDLLKHCYEVEKRLFPNSVESQRLL